MAAKKNGSRETPFDELIRRSVEAALTTWLSGSAMRMGEDYVREVFKDEEERAAFRARVREQAQRVLERLGK
jgi:hypothetical protein